MLLERICLKLSIPSVLLKFSVSHSRLKDASFSKTCGRDIDLEQIILLTCKDSSVSPSSVFPLTELLKKKCDKILKCCPVYRFKYVTYCKTKLFHQSYPAYSSLIILSAEKGNKNTLCK